MQKLSLSALKAKSSNVVSLEVMNKITGGNKVNCHPKKSNRASLR